MANGITFSHHGDFKKTTKFLDAVSGGKYIDNVLEKYAKEGVKALSEATPKLTGKTAASWDYKIINNNDHYRIVWTNNNMAGKYNVSVVVLLQNGHATKGGGYVPGRNFVDPAIQPVMDEILDKIWREVTEA